MALLGVDQSLLLEVGVEGLQDRHRSDGFRRSYWLQVVLNHLRLIEVTSQRQGSRCVKQRTCRADRLSVARHWVDRKLLQAWLVANFVHKRKRLIRFVLVRLSLLRRLLLQGTRDVHHRDIAQECAWLHVFLGRRLALSGRCFVRLLLIDVEHVPACFHVQVYVACWLVLTRLISLSLRTTDRHTKVLVGYVGVRGSVRKVIVVEDDVERAHRHLGRQC